ncbi:phage protein [Vibrio parahaemolyticus]|uniref:phage protein n=1 Tax=Vibrio parahaemolyticus TaxID=670 RepID=UPI0011223202|nr:phage protein [Vibrio parahaemolyticus]EHH1172443.1 DUF2597 family protein [Vibrio parahaemolyticus]MBE4266490.1 DUF2597 family protein [Vibrio parahaemolyticus]MBE4415833.1 DUF2597 family protein [Vibrio parahaemolyticus]TOQ51364.1 phage tail protein [Vibrio parahaemolyticus]HCE3660157.1 DUF2597 family protein [Vibrio parahaemolyticus]
MGKRISGMSFDVDIHNILVHVEKATVSITDDSQAAQTRGVPDDFTDGAVSAETEYELDTKNFKLLIEAAKAAGSFRGIEPHDCLFYANTGSEELEIKVHGVKLMIDSLLDIDPSSADKSIHKVKGVVTSADFIHIDGIPYLSENDTRDLIG